MFTDGDGVHLYRKTIWRKFGGLMWGSREFWERAYPHYMCLQKAVPVSCAIKCADFAYLAMFDVIAGAHTFPFIFKLFLVAAWNCRLIFSRRRTKLY
jgi:hypothetical protein